MTQKDKYISINRRDFLKVLGTTGASLVIGIYLGSCDQAPSETPDATATTKPTDEPKATTITEAEPEPTPTQAPLFEFEPNIYLKIDNRGNVTVTAFRSEMGQGIRTAIAMLLADELDVPWESITIEQAPADPAYGNQVTGGSASISGSYYTLRIAGAVVRQMLVNAAALQWEVDPVGCTTEPGFVVDPASSERLAYGDLVEAASELDVPETGEFRVKAESDFRYMSTGIGHWDAPAMVVGKAIYGIDVKLPGMLYAAIARCPVFEGTIASYDDSQALAIPGVQSVYQFEDRIAVVAENTWAAIQGRAALEIEWHEGQNADLSSASIRESLTSRTPTLGSAGEGEIEAIYEFPYQAHATMEPMNCTAHVHDGICELWAPTQSPQEVQSLVARYTGIPRDSVIVNVTLIGGGFGRRLQGDYAVEAALVSMMAEAPVHTIWTRDDDMQHDYYHPISYQYASGNPDAFRQPSIRSADGDGFIPTGAWRSVGEHPAAYVRQCFIDELAFAADVDPLDYRREIYNGRALAVIELAAEMAGWGEALPKGWGRGIAYHATFGVTHVAQVAEVEVTPDGQVRVHRVVCAVDCGIVVNPDTVTAQMEGGIAFGLTAALKAGITLENGRVQQSNFHDCPMLTIDEMPVVEVHIVESVQNPSGIGEMGVPPIAPAVANAVFNATGKRVRHLPIKPEDLRG